MYFKKIFHGAIIFAKRDIKTRYAGSFLGVVWIVLYPLSLSTISASVFSVVFRGTVEGVPYFIYTLSGFLVWTFLYQCLTSSSRLIISNRDIVVNNKIDTEMIVFGAVLSRLVDLTVNVLFLLLLCQIFNSINLSIAGLFISIFSIITLVSSLSLLLAMGSVFIRDIQSFIEIVMNICFYATPIVYPLTAAPDWAKALIKLNPFATVIQNFRNVIFFDASSRNYIIITFQLIIFVFVWKIYKRLETKFAQLI